MKVLYVIVKIIEHSMCYGGVIDVYFLVFIGLFVGAVNTALRVINFIGISLSEKKDDLDWKLTSTSQLESCNNQPTHQYTNLQFFSDSISIRSAACHRNHSNTDIPSRTDRGAVDHSTNNHT